MVTILQMDIGDLSIDDLRAGMQNQKMTPFWKMHPVIKHCLMCYQDNIPGSVEVFDFSTRKWLSCIEKATSMLTGVYRLNSTLFDPNFIREKTSFEKWGLRHFKLI